MAPGETPSPSVKTEPPLPGEPAPEHPEAHGFGASKRGRKVEFWVVLGLVLALPLLGIWGARLLAARLAMSLPPSVDVQLGRPSWEAFAASPERCKSAAAERYVAAIAAPLLSALGETPFKFHFLVLDASEVNAFALPGGYVVVNRGLLDSALQGDEVAGVLAHELSHVLERHSTKRLVGSLGAGVALNIIFGVVDLGAPALTVAALSSLGYDRDQEREADEKGREILIRAGISPAGMATFFERLSGSVSLPEFISTHPDPGNRAEAARQAAAGHESRFTLPAPPKVECD